MVTIKKIKYEIILDYISVTDIGALGNNDNPMGITSNGTNFFVVDEVDALVYEYTAAWALVGSHALHVANADPHFITWDGTFFYVTDTTDDVYKYNAAWVWQATYNPYSVTNLRGIEWDGTNFYITDQDEIHKYSSVFVYIESFDIGALGGNDLAFGLDKAEDYFYVIDYTDVKIYKYNSDCSVLLRSYNLNALNAAPHGLYWDGTYFYVVDYTDKSVYKYEEKQSIQAETDISSDTLKWQVTHKIRDIPKCQMLINSANQTVTSDDIIKITGNVNDHFNSKMYQAALYYKQSLDFRNETLGAFPVNADYGTWVNNSGGTCTAKIVDKYAGHARMLQLIDNDNGQVIDVDYQFTSGIEAGSVEFYFSTSDTNKQTELYLQDEGGATTAGIRIDADHFYYRSNIGLLDFGDTEPEDSKLYRMTLTFDCSINKYSCVIVDTDGGAIASQSNITMASGPNTVDHIQFYTHGFDSQYMIFIGAIGITGVNNYTLGDNANLEAILPDKTIFEGMIEKKDKKKIQKLWLKSLSDESKNIMPGDETTAYEPDGYNPNIANYTEEVIAETINVKCNDITATPSDEIYRGNYSFDNDANGAFPMGWLDRDGAGCATTVATTSLGGHKNYLDCFDNGAGSIRAENFFEPQISGTVEYRARHDVNNRESNIRLYTNNGDYIAVSLHNDGNIKFRTGAAWADFTAGAEAYAADTWYIIRMDFCCDGSAYLGLAADTYNVYIYSEAGAELAAEEGIAFDVAATTINYLRVYTDAAAVGLHAYYGNFGYSWDSFYDIGDNKHIYIPKIEVGASTLDLALDGSKTIKKVTDTAADNEVFTWGFDPDHALIYTEGDLDSGLDFGSSQVWAVQGIDKVKRINKVWLKGGFLAGVRQYGNANNLDSQDTYGIKLVVKFYTLFTVEGDLDAIALNILTYEEAVAKTVGLYYANSNIDFIQPGQTVTIAASDIRYSGNDDIYVDAGEWLITFVKVEGMGSTVKWLDIDLKDALEFEYDIEDAQELEFLINQ